MKKISKKTTLSRKDTVSKVGILEWFGKNDFSYVRNTIDDLHAIGLNDLRFVISSSEYYEKGGLEWFDWLIPRLARQFIILPCVVYSPSNERQDSSYPDPKVPADFISEILKRYGKYFETIELDAGNGSIPEKARYDEMILLSAYSVKKAKKRMVLGGLNSSDFFWLSGLAERNIFQNIDVIGIKKYPQTPSPEHWTEEIMKIREILDRFHLDTEIWITETGYSTWKHDEQNQILSFIDAENAPVKKVYWNSLYDTSLRSATETEKENHFGIKRANGISKMLFRALTRLSPGNLETEPLFAHPVQMSSQSKKGVLITGGAGFIGTNVANRLLENGERIIIYDNLSRPGVENNLKWLQSKYPNVEVMIADVKDYHTLQKAINEASHIFHFAAQVAVTSSLVYPEFDHEVNVGGTMNVLEAIRTSTHKPSLIYTSTNKVYGDLSGLEIKNNETRYSPADAKYSKNGIDETYPLNFHSPYGCSKGAADQYIIDYARSYGLRNVVFRMSCIYGPHQFGTEDQGWVAHFIRQSIQNKKIILYGDGKQVRDILYIEDLVDAFLLARQNIQDICGEAFNIGGGPENTVSLIELLDYMSRLDHLNIQIEFDKWRTGDQKYYVSDTRKFKSRTGWQPKISYMDGITKLYNWIHQMQDVLSAASV